MATKEMPIFTRTFDFISWLLPATNHFPRAHRHTFTQRLLDTAFDLNDRLEEANRRRGPALRNRNNPNNRNRNNGFRVAAATFFGAGGWPTGNAGRRDP